MLIRYNYSLKKSYFCFSYCQSDFAFRKPLCAMLDDWNFSNVFMNIVI